jgi:hypothetical protein
MIGNFRRLLTKTAELPINEQKEFLSNTIVEWQGGLEQVDDILIIGLKV